MRFILGFIAVLVIVGFYLFYVFNFTNNIEVSDDVSQLISITNQDVDDLSQPIFVTDQDVDEAGEEVSDSEVEEKREEVFQKYGLKTNTAKSSIDLKLVLSGGPKKDGIPAINNPKFVSIDKSSVGDDVRGILVDIDGVQRFYPYSIIVWHEIVNDSIGDNKFSVTFCPLCDTGIVFNRDVQGEVLQFGVSGLLFESNLLMYDSKTESLWSQAKGEAVIGDYLGEKLELFPLQLLTFEEIKEKYPSASVLSSDTGYSRDYTGNPYSGYELSNSVIFPVSNRDDRFHPKEPFYVIPFKGKSLAFPFRRLSKRTHEFDIDGDLLIIERIDNEVYVRSSGERIPGYFEFWFSWITNHKEDGVVLDV